MVTLRALRARLAQSAVLVCTGALVVASCVAAFTYRGGAADAGGTAAGVLLLGVVALAAQAAASLRSRRQEIALAALRGRHGLRLLTAAVAEPAFLLVLADLIGLAVGVVMVRASGVGTPAAPDLLGVPRAGWLAAIIVVAVCLATVAVVTWGSLRQPLNAGLADARRTSETPPTVVFLQFLVLVGAAVTVYRAQSLGVRHADWVSFVSPALVGLAVGQLGILLASLLARSAVRSPRYGASLRWYVTLRRFSRSAISLSPLRIVVAAAVVAGIAATAWLRGGTWMGDTARINAGGPITFAVPAGALQAFAASHEADPQGRWLMAMSATRNLSGGSGRDVFVDAARWQRVVGPFYAGSPVAPVTQHIRALAEGPPLQWTRGHRASLTLAAGSLSTLPNARELRRLSRAPIGLGFIPLQFAVQYVNSIGASMTVHLPESGPQLRPVRSSRFSIKIGDCSSACSVQNVMVQGITRKGPLGLVALRFGNLQLIPNGVSHLQVLSSKGVSASVTKSGVRLKLADPYSPSALLTWTHPAAPALATTSTRLHSRNGHEVAAGIDGHPRPITVTDEVPALPLLGTEGVLLDLGTALRGAGAPVAETKAVVVARADTPAVVLHRLRQLPVVGKREGFRSALARLQNRGAAHSVGIYLLLAAFAVLIAALGVVSTVVEQRDQRRKEAAALHVAGLETGRIEAGYRVEVAALGALVAVIAALGIGVGCAALLEVLPLVPRSRFDVSLDASPLPTATVGLAAAAGIYVALVWYLGLRRVSSASPSTLQTDMR